MLLIYRQKTKKEVNYAFLFAAWYTTKEKMVGSDSATEVVPSTLKPTPTPTPSLQNSTERKRRMAVMIKVSMEKQCQLLRWWNWFLHQYRNKQWGRQLLNTIPVLELREEWIHGGSSNCSGSVIASSISDGHMVIKVRILVKLVIVLIMEFREGKWRQCIGDHGNE